MTYDSHVVSDSISPDGVRLTSMIVVFPRFVLAEFNTHRMFSRNSASSRAIPIKVQLEKVKSDPFVPIYWGQAQAKMQAYEMVGHTSRVKSEKEWLGARDDAVRHVERLMELGLHKQIPNRLLEPFMWHTVLVTFTEVMNFFDLRINPGAQPEIQVAAELMKEAFDASEPNVVDYGRYHLPLIQTDEQEWAWDNMDLAMKVGTARSGRLSYLTHDNVRDVSKDIQLYEDLLGPRHMSPFEHVARPLNPEEVELVRREQRSIVRNGKILSIDKQFIANKRNQAEFDGNFRLWHQHRKDIPFESDFSASRV